MATGLSEGDSEEIGTAEGRERTLVVGGERPIRVCAGHRIRHHDGKCARPHGHNYAVSVEVRGELTEEGWVVDKGAVTDVVEEWDHRFLLERGDPLVTALREAGEGDAVVELDAPPTAEVMSLVLEERLLEALPDTVAEVDVSVRETGELAVSQ